MNHWNWICKGLTQKQKHISLQAARDYSSGAKHAEKKKKQKKRTEKKKVAVKEQDGEEWWQWTLLVGSLTHWQGHAMHRADSSPHRPGLY